jgi:hypothetical protein
MRDLWRTLKVGDRVRVIFWPPELHEDRLHQETRELYRWLIDTKSVLAIVRIDELGLPEGKVCRSVNGAQRFEFLLLNHGGLEVVPDTKLP